MRLVLLARQLEPTRGTGLPTQSQHRGRPQSERASPQDRKPAVPNFRDNIYSAVYFEGSVTNKSTDVVVTEYTIFVDHKSAPTKPTRKTFRGKWIEPNHSDNFTIGSEELAYVPDAAEEREPGKFSWGWPDTALGLQISF